MPATLLILATTGLLAQGPLTCCRELADVRNDVENVPFCITGQVLQVNCARHDTELILRDKTGTARLADKFGTKIAVGNLVVVRGTTHSAPRKGVTSLTVIGSRPLPAPRRACADEIPSGACDWQSIRLHGLLQDVFLSEFNQEWCCITLNSDGAFVHASTPNVNGVFEHLSGLTDSVVELDGVVLPHDGSPRTKIGRILHFSGCDSIRVVRPPPQDQFDKPDIAETYGLSPSVVSSRGRHSVIGRVIARWNDTQALLRSRRGEVVKIAASAPLSAQPGDFVKAVGLPVSDLYHINLTAASLRPTDPFPDEEPPVADFHPEAVTNLRDMRPFASLHGRRVKVTGLVRNLPTDGKPARTFHLDVGNRLVSVDVSTAPEVCRVAENGSRVELTGVLVLAIENWSPRQAFPRINGFFLVLQSPVDVRVLARPAWWTRGRLLALIGALLLTLIAICVWNLSLRHLAARKGRELMREQLGRVKADLRTEERTRLAVELHDTLAQNLTGVSMEIAAAQDLRGNAPQEMLDHLGIAGKALKSCRDELRNCLWDLRSQALDERDMTTAVLRTLQPHVNDSRLAVRFNVPRNRLSDKTAHALLRVIRELVVNAIRHGEATSVKVAGTLDEGRLLCSVTDNGKGFSPATAPGVLQGHFGLQGVRERLEEIGGTVEIDSAPGLGTKALVALAAPAPAKESK